MLRLRMVSATQLLGLVPRSALRSLPPDVRVVILPVKELNQLMHVGVFYRKDAYLSPAAKRFIEILRATAKEIANESR